MTGIVLGSGLGALAAQLRVEREVTFAEAGLANATVTGHSGKFVFGQWAGENVLAMMGRLHLYEGHPAKDVSAGLRWMASEGIDRVILTNAAGSMNPDFPPGHWMRIDDHLNLTGTSPLEGAHFIDLTAAYDPAWGARCDAAATNLGMPALHGVYAGLRGPQYETPAEIRMLRHLGADAVGMSTVLETIQARALGLPVIGYSCLTNWAAGIQPAPLNHAEVLATGQHAAAVMIKLLENIIHG